MSNLSDIGFPVRGEQDVNDLIQSLLPHIREIGCARGSYYKFADPSGAEIYLQANLQQELIGFNPHYAGESRFVAGLTQNIYRDSSELDGGFHAWSSPSKTADSELTGEYPFVFDVPDFLTNGIPEFPQIVEIQLTAFASNDFRVYESEAAYLESQETEIKFAVRHFIPSGLFQPDAPPIPVEQARPIAILAGAIKRFELKTNELSGENFYSFLVETLGGEIDVVADPKLITEDPQTGGIVSGQFWLSGRLLNPVALM